MTNALSLTVGVDTITVPLKGTNQQLRASLRRFVISQGVNVAGKTADEIGEMALRLMAKYVIDSSSDLQRQELLEEQKSAIATRVASDNDLIDLLVTTATR